MSTNIRQDPIEPLADAPSITLACRLVESLQTAIVEGAFKPGEKLREPDLARTYGTSRGPIRDALRRLESRRLVTNTPNAGARVTSLSAARLIELYQVREALEGMTARLAAEHMSDADIERLSDLLDQHEREIARKDGQQLFRQEGDLDFHYRIARGCGNALLGSVLCDDHYQLMRLYRYKFGGEGGRPMRALHEHRRIVEAIAERDGELAELFMRRHIRAARQTIEAAYADELTQGETRD